MLRFIPLATLLVLVSGTRELAAQRRPSGKPVTESSNVSIVARVGAKSYTATVPGSCEHEPSASIYDLPAALYRVDAQGADGSAIKQLSLTLWRPKDGSADQTSLSLEAGSTSSRIDVSPRTKGGGRATVQLKPSGDGGTFEIKGKDAKGAALSLTITCPSFAAVEAAGG
jgi:hypothetical protein